MIADWAAQPNVLSVLNNEGWLDFRSNSFILFEGRSTAKTNIELIDVLSREVSNTRRRLRRIITCWDSWWSDEWRVLIDRRTNGYRPAEDGWTSDHSARRDCWDQGCDVCSLIVGCRCWSVDSGNNLRWQWNRRSSDERNQLAMGSAWTFSRSISCAEDLERRSDWLGRHRRHSFPPRDSFLHSKHERERWRDSFSELWIVHTWKSTSDSCWKTWIWEKSVKWKALISWSFSLNKICFQPIWVKSSTRISTAVWCVLVKGVNDQFCSDWKISTDWRSRLLKRYNCSSSIVR